jgi:hypothetical protein
LSAFTYVLNYCAQRNKKKMKKLKKKAAKVRASTDATPVATEKQGNVV